MLLFLLCEMKIDQPQPPTRARKKKTLAPLARFDDDDFDAATELIHVGTAV